MCEVSIVEQRGPLKISRGEARSSRLRCRNVFAYLKHHRAKPTYARMKTIYLVATELEDAADRVSDDGTSEVSHVHLLGDVWAGKVHQHPRFLNFRRGGSILPNKSPPGHDSGIWFEKDQPSDSPTQGISQADRACLVKEQSRNMSGCLGDRAAHGRKRQGPDTLTSLAMP